MPLPPPTLQTFRIGPASGKTNFCYSCLRRGLAGNRSIQESGAGRASTLWSSGSARASLSPPRQQGGHRGTHHSPPGSTCSSAQACPRPCFYSSLHSCDGAITGRLGARDAKRHLPLTTETPQTGTSSIKHKYRPQGPASPASSLPVPHALQSTVHCSPFSRKYTCKSLFSSPPSSPSPKRKKAPIKSNRSLPQHAY